MTNKWLIVACLSVLLWTRQASGQTVADLRHALDDFPATAQAYVDQNGVDKPLAVRTRGDGAALIVAKPDTPTPPDQPSAKPPYGYFALQPGAHAPPGDLSPPKGTRLVSEADLRRGLVAGLTIRFRPTWISVNGRWDFSFVDSCVQRCERTGDRFTLLLMGGGSNPTAESNLNFYEQAAQQLANRYENHPLCAGAHITGCSNPGTSEELHWERPMPAAAIAANKRLIDAWCKSFDKHVCLLAVSGKDPAAMKQIIDYAQAWHPGQVLIKHNSLKSSTSLSAEHNQLIVYAGKKGMPVGFEMVGPAGDVARFGPGGIMAGVNKGKELLRGAGLDPEKAYYAIYPPADLVGLR
jgi:hypothetical protein